MSRFDSSIHIHGHLLTINVFAYSDRYRPRLDLSIYIYIYHDLIRDNADATIQRLTQKTVHVKERARQLLNTHGSELRGSGDIVILKVWPVVGLRRSDMSWRGERWSPRAVSLLHPILLLLLSVVVLQIMERANTLNSALSTRQHALRKQTSTKCNCI